MKCTYLTLFVLSQASVVAGCKKLGHVHFTSKKGVTFATLSATLATEGTPFGTPFLAGVPWPTA